MKTKLIAVLSILILLILVFGAIDVAAEYPEDGRPNYEPDPGVEEKPEIFNPEDGWLDDKRRGHTVTEPPPWGLWNFPPP